MSKRIVYKNGTVRVYFDSEIQEYHITDRSPSDEYGYYTDDKEDAINTADTMTVKTHKENPHETTYVIAYTAGGNVRRHRWLYRWDENGDVEWDDRKRFVFATWDQAEHVRWDILGGPPNVQVQESNLPVTER